MLSANYAGLASGPLVAPNILYHYVTYTLVHTIGKGFFIKLSTRLINCMGWKSWKMIKNRD